MMCATLAGSACATQLYPRLIRNKLLIYRGIILGSLFALSLQAAASAAEQNPATSSCHAKTVTSQVSEQTSSDPTLTITADKVTGRHLETLEFLGKVEVTQGDRKLEASQAVLNQQTNTLSADGSVHYLDSGIEVHAQKLLSSGKPQKVELHGSTYKMRNDGSRGKAGKLELNQQEKLFTLRNGSFTTCPEGDNSWLLSADKIELNGKTEWGEAYDSVIYIADIPVLWVPYMNFPLTDKRKTGLLFPTISNSTDRGLDIAQPVYWNIQENMDATLTPRYLSMRGAQLAAEFRHLSDKQFNQINVEYLSSDLELADKSRRYLVYWLQQSQFNTNWRSLVEFTHVSDDNYFNDLDSTIGHTSESRLERVARLDYLSESLDVSFAIRDFMVFGDNEAVYRQLPQIDIAYRLPHFSNYFDGGLVAEATYFSHPSGDKANSLRFHLEPNLAYNWQTPAASFGAEAKYYQTFYRQDNSSGELERLVSRSIPSVRIFGQLNFERQTQFWGEEYTQTLEPKLQYLYAEYENQDQIGSYDTTRMRDGVYGLFRDRRFSSLDRIADANQITLGVTSRLRNSANRETLRLSVGQIFYLSDSKLVQDLTGREGDKASAFAMTLDTFWGDFNLHGEYQYSFERKTPENSNLLLNYEPGPRKLVQLSYHYSPEPLNFNGSAGSNSNRLEINQTGLVVSWPVSESLQLVGSHYTDLKWGRSVESLAGIQYQSCCWAARAVYQRSLSTNYDDDSGQGEFDAGIYLQFEIKGFGGSSDLSGHKNMIDKSLFGYRRNYYLNN